MRRAIVEREIYLRGGLQFYALSPLAKFAACASVCAGTSWDISGEQWNVRNPRSSFDTACVAVDAVGRFINV